MTTTRTITGTITTGYTLASNYSTLQIVGSGQVIGQAGSGLSGGAGGAGVTISASPSNRTLTNAGIVIGGAGGYGQTGGAGGGGVSLAGGGYGFNTGAISGGAGGSGNAGVGGAGGVGLYLVNGGNISNRGSIRGGAGGAGSGGAGAAGNGIVIATGGTVINGFAGSATATISGAVGVYAGIFSNATVNNFGTIQGLGGTSVQFKSTNDRLIAEAGSTFLGTAQGGGGTLELGAGAGTISGLGSTGTVSGAEALTFAGFGSYILDSAGAWTLKGNNTLSAGKSLVDAGSLANTGRLMGGVKVRAAIAMTSGATLVNGGPGIVGALVSGSADGIYAGPNNKVGIYNFGTIRGVHVQGIALEGGGTISNGSQTYSKASIRGAYDGVYALLQAASVNNFGTITGSGNVGVALRAGGAVSNGGTGAQSATIVGYFDGVNGAGASTSVANFGTIQGRFLGGVVLAQGGAVVNGGTTNVMATISGYEDGVYGGGSATTVTNFGTIAGARSQGVYLSAGGVITNGAAGATTSLITGAGGVFAYGSIATTVINFGTIQGTGGTSILFQSAQDRLIAEAGSTFVGVAQGGGGTLELAAGPGTITGLGGTATAYGADALTFSGFGSYTLDSGSAWTLAGYDRLSIRQKLTNNGTLTLIGAMTNLGAINSNGVGIVLASGGNLQNGSMTVSTAAISGVVGVYAGPGSAATVTNFGAIQGTGGRSVQFMSASDRLIAGPGSTFLGTVLGGGGSLQLKAATGTLTGLGAVGSVVGPEALTFSGFGSYFIDSGGSWTLGGANTLTAAASLLIAGSLTITGTVNNAGRIIGATGSVITLANGDIVGGLLRSSETITVSGISSILDGTASALTLNANLSIIDKSALTLKGAINNTIGVNLAASTSTTSLIIAAAGVNLGGHGLVTLGASGLSTLTGATSTAILTNVDNTIIGSGLIGNGSLTLVNGSSGLIEQTGAGALTINVGASTINNQGTIEATGTGGATIFGAINNAGLLEVTGGSLAISGVVVGSGSAVINGGTLIFGGAVSENVVFSGSTGILLLSHSTAFRGNISGFSLTGGTALDLRDIRFVSSSQATFSGNSSGGVLTVTDGVHTSKINFSGNFSGSSWITSSDGAGGVIVVDPNAPTSASVQAFSAAMAAIAAMGPGQETSTSILDNRGAPASLNLAPAHF